MSNTTIRDNVAVGEPDLLKVAPSANPNGATPNANTSVSMGVGAFSTSGDGRGYRFAYDGGTALVVGALYQSPAQVSGWENVTSTGNIIGDTTVTLGSSITVAADAMKGGYLVVRKGTGQGNFYAVSGNLAAAAGAVTIYLSDPIRVATDSSAVIDVIPSPFNGIVIQPTTATSAPAGIAIVATAGTQYAWVQTHGAVAVQNDGASTIAVGHPVGASITTAGNVTAFLNGTTPALVGYALETISGTNWGMVQLQLD